MGLIQRELPEDVLAEVRRRAETRGVTMNLVLTELVRRGASSWPGGYFEEVVGGWKGEPLQRPPQGAQEVRDDL